MRSQRPATRTRSCNGRTVRNRPCKKSAPPGRAYCGQCATSLGHVPWAALQSDQPDFVLPAEVAFGQDEYILPDLIDPVAHSQRGIEREAVAESVASTHSTLAWLAGDESVNVRKCVAENFATSAAVLAILAQDSHYRVQEAAIDNPMVSCGTLEELAGDDNWDVVAAVAAQRKTPPYVLRQITDRIPTEPTRYQQHLKQRQFATLRDCDVVEELVRNRNTPLSVLQTLASLEFPKVCLAIVQHPESDASIMEIVTDRCAGDWQHAEHVDLECEKRVMMQVAKHPETSAETLRRLFETRMTASIGDVRTAAAEHPNLPADIGYDIATDDYSETGIGLPYALAHNPRLTAKEARALLDNPTAKCNLVLARKFFQKAIEKGHISQNEVNDLLLTMSTDDDPEVRFSIAANGSTPDELLTVLMADSDESVRNAASRQMSGRIKFNDHVY